MFLSREFKHDETNRAWWTGRWYGRGLGSHVMSQPAREFVVKIIELSLWSSDLLLGHFLLFMLTPPILVPYIDRLHAMVLCKTVDYLVVIITDEYLSLAAPIKTDSCPVVLSETEKATSPNREWQRMSQVPDF